MRPKWMLTHPSGRSMLAESIKGLDLSNVDNIYAVVLKSHVKTYDFLDGIQRQIDDDRFKFIVLDRRTKNQPETLAKAIKQEGITGAVACKDSDNFFSCKVKAGNFVAVADLCDMGSINAGNKSYVETNSRNEIVSIAEKDVISSKFCCGLYGFEYASAFVDYYEELKNQKDIYISHIIHSMMLHRFNFTAVNTKEYIDWGTLEDWNKFRDGYKTIFLDIDGCMVKSSSDYMKPKLGTTKGIKDNIKVINEMYDSGKVEIILTTARPNHARELTEKQLTREGLKYHRLITGLQHNKRVVINDFAKTNTYRSCDAINLPRNSETLRDYL
jgi:hypothetical protein